MMMYVQCTPSPWQIKWKLVRGIDDVITVFSSFVLIQKETNLAFHGFVRISSTFIAGEWKNWRCWRTFFLILWTSFSFCVSIWFANCFIISTNGRNKSSCFLSFSIHPQFPPKRNTFFLVLGGFANGLTWFCLFNNRHKNMGVVQ